MAALLFLLTERSKKMQSTEALSPTLESLVRKSRRYAGIGSRSTPLSVLLLMEQIAAALAGCGLLLRSGGSPGADTAFETGCDRAGGKKEIFLPWKGFNRNQSLLCSPPERAEMIAAFCHPNWGACNQGSRKLHARNCQQIYGEDLETPVDFVLFWAPEEDGTVEGGTATAVFLAREMKIPTFNLWEERRRERWEGLANIDKRRKRYFWRNIFKWLENREKLR